MRLGRVLVLEGCTTIGGHPFRTLWTLTRRTIDQRHATKLGFNNYCQNDKNLAHTNNTSYNFVQQFVGTKGIFTTWANTVFLRTFNCSFVPIFERVFGTYAIAMLWPSVGLGHPEVTVPTGCPSVSRTSAPFRAGGPSDESPILLLDGRELSCWSTTSLPRKPPTLRRCLPVYNKGRELV